MILYHGTNMDLANKMTTQQQTDYLIAHIVDEMTQYLMADFNLDIAAALNVIYNSNIFAMLQDTDNDLYIQSLLSSS